MMDQIRDYKDVDSAKLCRTILAVMSTVRRPITLDELAVFVDIPEEASAEYQALAETIRLCGSFLTIRNRTISLIHQFAKDFLLGDAAQGIFPSGIKEIHYLVFSRSLHIMSRILQRDIYSLVSPGSSINDVKLPNPDPLAAARYSCVYWVDHLDD